jgi:exoribonuclease-2
MTNLDNIARRAMLEHDLLPDFSAAALEEANAAGSPRGGSRQPVRDLQRLPWSSIDNDDSRDLDQLTVAEALDGGATRLCVAIADVDALVAIDSSVDDHAKTNTTSVYTAARTFPMLPEKLSTDRTSLNEGQERPVIVVEITVDRAGEIAASAIYRARVVNHAKLAYDSVAAWLDGAGPEPPRIGAVAGLAAQLRLQDQAAQSLRRVRRERGALDLETVEARPVFKDEALTDLRADERNRAKELIEDFMIAANRVVAKYLDKAGRASIRRVLRSPERWVRIVALAREHGGELPPEPDAIALNRFLTTRRDADPQGFADLSLSVIKLLGAGEYAVNLPDHEPVGHFGLAVHDYTHSTAPNRRFPDLVTQRLLKAALDDAPAPYSTDQLTALAQHCNTQQRNATKVERLVRKAAASILLSSRVGERFDGVVTGASDKGTWVRINRPVAEGKIVRGFQGLDVGDRVKVRLVDVQPERGFIDFARER